MHVRLVGHRQVVRPTELDAVLNDAAAYHIRVHLILLAGHSRSQFAQLRHVGRGTSQGEDKITAQVGELRLIGRRLLSQPAASKRPAPAGPTPAGAFSPGVDLGSGRDIFICVHCRFIRVTVFREQTLLALWTSCFLIGSGSLQSRE